MVNKDSNEFDIKDLNLKEKFPNYFNVWVFRSAIILMILIFAYILYLEDWQLSNSNNVYFTCHSNQPCKNPFYDCVHQNNSIQHYGYNSVNCNELLSLNAPANLSKIEYILPNQTIGKPPLYGWVYNVYFLIIAGAFILNHIMYKIKNWRNLNGIKTKSKK